MEPDLVGREGHLSPSRALNWVVRGASPWASHVLLLPASFWLLLFLLLPAAGLLGMSFLTRGDYGTILPQFTLANYAAALDPKYLPVLLRTAGYAATATAVCLLLGYPLAYYLSFYAGRRREALLVLLMIPFWTSCLVALYSWIIILGREGMVNALLVKLGLSPIGFLNTPFSVILGLVYFYLPFMVLPLYGSLDKIPRSLIEASYDLGAGAGETFMKVTLPLSLPGVFAGCLLTFIPCMGDFLTADFLGGPSTYLIGNLIQNQFLMAQNWTFGAALTTLLVLCLASGLYLYRRLEQDEE